jgi:hypothetical protein
MRDALACRSVMSFGGATTITNDAAKKLALTPWVNLYGTPEMSDGCNRHKPRAFAAAADVGTADG